MIFVQIILNKLNLMKAKIVPIIVFSVFFSQLFISCEDTTYKEYTGNEPVYLAYENLRQSVIIKPGTGMKNPGKIYFKDNFIFIVEELKGIHVFDNTDPSSPVNKAFINIPGVVDISVSGYIMYVDSYVDLVVLDIQDISNIHEAGRVKDIFPYTVPPVTNKYPMANVDQDKGVVTDWKLKTIKEKVKNVNTYPVFWEKGAFYDMMNVSGASSGVSGSGIGIGGSMARFGIKEKVLYVVDQSTLRIFDITNKTSPVKFDDLNPGWGIETMFLTEKNMFLGTTTGMVIYDLSVPLSPVKKSFFNHARSCDPVIVDDTLAYITLRTGTNCGGSTNCLDIVNIKNILKPVRIATYPMVSPHGLAKAGDLLFICDGTSGFKIYDASSPYQITGRLVYTYPAIDAFDVIPVGNVLMMIGDDGFYQYSYSDVKNIRLLSTIPVDKN
jgi:hypothetical protein